MKSVVNFAKGIAGICGMSGRLEAVPYSGLALIFSLALFGLSRYQLHSLEHTQEAAIQVGLWASFALMVVTLVGLILTGKLGLIGRTLTTLAATGAVMALVTAIVRIFFFVATPEEANIGKMIGFIMFPLLLWNLMVYAYIFRHTFAGRPVLALTLAGFYVVPISYGLAAIFPA